MSIEQRIRKKQALEKQSRKFLFIAASMSAEELEIALGRLADQLTQEGDVIEQAHITLKGFLLKAYLDLRKQGTKRQNKIKRIAKYLLPDTDHPSMTAWIARCEVERIAWRARRAALPPLKRFFSDAEVPDGRLPPRPTIPMQERLIHSLAAYRLLPTGEKQPADTNTNQLLLLAP